MISFYPFKSLIPFLKDNNLSLDPIIEELKKHHPDANFEIVKKAYKFSLKAHQDQKRKSGEPYIVHPLKVGHTLAKLGLGEQAIAAGIVHDAVEDSSLTIKELRAQTSPTVAYLVEGITKLKRLQEVKIPKEQQDIFYENLRRMFIAMAKDLRVIIIKLVDRLHNMETLEHMSQEKRYKIAKQTLEIYVPIANRLGIGEIRGQLEDYAFMHVYPSEYEWLIRNFQKKYDEQKKYTQYFQNKLKKILIKEGVKLSDIHGRAKHLYSLYRKLQNHEKDINKIYDLVALRVIVKDIPECYKALGVIHQHFKPLSARFKDYISTPKPNGYQSLHTTVFSSEGRIVEVQIRTPRMHKEAEYGIAAHWAYSEKKGFKNYLKKILSKTPETELAWVQQLSRWQAKNKLDDKTFSDIKINFFTDRIFAFTPKGAIKELPLGSTPIDFAYAIHTEVGHNCQQAEVNGKFVTLDHQLVSGDVVNIITSKDKKGPTRDWIDFAKTDHAKNTIRKWFANANTESSLALGKKALEQELKEIKNTPLSKIPKNKIKKAIKELNYKTLEDILIAIGQGNLSPIKVIKHLFQTHEILPKKQITIQKQKQSTVKIDGKENILARFCQECKPKPGEKIKAYITSKGIATIHATDCDRITENKNKPRIIKAIWVKDEKDLFHTTLEIQSKNQPGTLKEIISIFHKMQINIENISTDHKKTPSAKTIINIEISIEGLDQLKNLIQQLKQIPNVLKVTKISR